jgi:inosine-uridine nucleoside N-ribohydrolase
MPSPIPVIIDTDPGIDDVVALALAVRSPELEIVALSTSYGNATLDRTTRNAHALLELADRSDITVHPGTDRPLSRPLVTAPETHGPSGVGYAAVMPEAAAVTNPTVLCDLFAALEHPVTLVTLGPLTNLAVALERDSALVHQSVSRHIGMFGNINERGNTNRFADFNVWCDPEAAEVVLRAGLSTLMVGLDVTRRMTLSAHEVSTIAASADPLAAWLGQALRFYVEFHRSQERLDGCVVNDVLPIGELLAPGLLTVVEQRLTVDLGDGEQRGRTREDDAGAATGVALSVDTARMRELMGRVVGWID